MKQFDLLNVLEKLGSQLNYSSHQRKNSTRLILSYLPSPAPTAVLHVSDPVLDKYLKTSLQKWHQIIGLPGVSTCPHLAPGSGKAKGSSSQSH